MMTIKRIWIKFNSHICTRNDHSPHVADQPIPFHSIPLDFIQVTFAVHEPISSQSIWSQLSMHLSGSSVIYAVRLWCNPSRYAKRFPVKFCLQGLRPLEVWKDLRREAKNSSKNRLKTGPEIMPKQDLNSTQNWAKSVPNFGLNPAVIGPQNRTQLGPDQAQPGLQTGPQPAQLEARPAGLVWGLK